MCAAAAACGAAPSLFCQSAPPFLFVTGAFFQATNHTLDLSGLIILRRGNRGPKRYERGGGL